MKTWWYAEGPELIATNSYDADLEKNIENLLNIHRIQKTNMKFNFILKKIKRQQSFLELKFKSKRPVKSDKIIP